MNKPSSSAQQQEVKQRKPTCAYEQSDFGLRVIYQNGGTSVIDEALCQNPLGSAAIASARLYALSNLLTGSGWDAFDELHGHDQQCVLEVIHGLAAQTAALTRLAETVDLDALRTKKAAEVANV